MRQLVPERRLPGELARRARLRRVQRDDTAEAGAQRADHPGQPEVADGKSSCIGKSRQDRSLGSELVFGREVFERLLRERHCESRITGASSASSFTMRSPSFTTLNASSLSSISSRLKVTRS